LLASDPAFGTAIYAVRTPTFIEIVSDSKATYQGVPGPPIVCKIARSGHSYFAVAGMGFVGRVGGKGSFSVSKIIASSLAGLGSLQDRMLKAQSVLVKAATEQILQLRKNNKPIFDQAVKGDGVFIAVIAAEYENGTPALAELSIKFDKASGQVTSKFFGCPSDGCQKSQGLVIAKAGYTDEGVPILTQPGDQPAETRLLGAVNTEIQQDPSVRQ
jgi:hypothetical protein